VNGVSWMWALVLGLVWQTVAVGFDRPVEARECGPHVWVREAGGTSWIVERGVRHPRPYEGRFLCPFSSSALDVRGSEVGRWIEPVSGAMPEVRIESAREGDELVFEARLEPEQPGLTFAWSFDDDVEIAGRRVRRSVPNQAEITVFLNVTAPGRTRTILTRTVPAQGSR